MEAQVVTIDQPFHCAYEKFRLYRIWCGGILQICGDGSQFAVLPRLNDRKLSQSGLESLSIVCRRSILMLFSHN